MPFVPQETYHLFNRSITRQPLFLSPRDYQRALEVIHFYSFPKPNLRFSHYNRLPQDKRVEFLEQLTASGKRSIQIVAFCLMPNHVHFLVKELEDKGISSFMSNIQNSYAKYFNTKRKRSGALFQSMFKAVRIETDEHLIHVARYIHLNPFSSFVVKDLSSLEDYPWSSLPDYLGKCSLSIVDTSVLLGYFSSRTKLKQFIFDQADYQQKLEKTKHLLLE